MTKSRPEVGHVEDAPIERSVRRKRGGRRGRRAQLVGQINAKARERQQAWRETGQPDLTEELTRKLDRDFSDLRLETGGGKP